MKRRVKTEDLKWACELALRPQEGESWCVCSDYVIREETIVAKYALPDLVWVPCQPDSGPCPPPYSGVEDDYWRDYGPLEETPDLFLKLASLYEEASFEEAALAFSYRYGVLGGSSSEAGGRPDRTSLSVFRKEVKRAWIILRMYEAALNRDQEAANRLLSEHLAELVGPERLAHYTEKEFELSNVLVLAASEVSVTVGKLCTPVIFFTEQLAFQSELDFSGLRRGWLFSNLLGAAYLQMYWLMTSVGELSRCEHCGRIISLSRPSPEGRKRRRDRRFCDDACRQAHHRSKKKP